MSDVPRGPGWWQAADGRWYPPAPPEPPPASPVAPPSGQDQALPPPPSATTPGSLPPPPDAPAGTDTGGSRRRAWWMAAGAVIVVAAAVVALMLATGGDGDETESTDPASAPADVTVAPTSPEVSPPTEAALPTAEATPATTVAGVDPTVPATAPATAPATPATSPVTVPTEPSGSGEPACRYVGVDVFDDAQVEVSFTNPLGEVGSLRVSYALADGDGTRIISGTAFVDAPLADERFRVESDTFEGIPGGVDESAITCRVIDIEEGFGSLDDLVRPDGAVSCEFVEVDDFDDIQIDLVVTNPFPSVEDLRILVALRGAGGVRFGESSAFVDMVDPGETVRLSDDTLTELPDWVDEADFSCDVLGVAATDF